MKFSSVRRLGVEAGGSGLVGHVGLHALGLFADRLGVGASLSDAVPWPGERARAHDRGKVLTQAMLMLAGGGEACSDIEFLRAEGGLFGDVASAPTLYRTLRSLDPATVAGLWARHAAVREQVWARRVAVGAAAVFLDIDATLVEVHSENKAGAAAHFKGGYGFHPLLCFSEDGDALGAVLRPGNAAANNIDDHIALLDAAIGRLPGEVAAGHRRGDDDALATRSVVLRTDSAGCSTRIAKACRDRNVGYCLVARRNDAIDAAIAAVAVTDKRPQRAIRRDGDVRRAATVADLTEFVDTTNWPDGTRLIVRREPRHRGAQRSLFPSDAWRYWGHWTDQPGSAAACDARRRAHAVVEDHIGALKAAGLTRLPFTDFNANAARGRPHLLGALPRRVFPTTHLPRRPRQSRRQTPPLDALAHPRPPHPLRAPHHNPPPRQPPRRTTPRPHLRQHRRPLLRADQRPQKHHNRHHEPPGGPTTRAPTPTNHPKQHPTSPQPNNQTPPPAPNTPPKDPTNNQTTHPTNLMNNQG